MKRFFAILLMLTLLLSACSPAKERPEGALYVYYLNLQSNALVTEDYVPASQDAAGQVAELLEQMNTAPDTDVISVLSERFTVNSTEINGSILKLFLEGNRSELSYNAYLLTLAALTRTLTQADGINAILVYINGENVTDNNGRAFGLLRPVRFTNNASREENDYRVSEVRLYFANETGTRLTEQVKTVRDNNSSSPERTVLRELIAGPDTGSGYPVIPQGTSVLSLNTRDGICYLNLDDAFASGLEAGKEELGIYAIVNSLTMLDGVEQVQFAINGNSEVTLGLSKLSLASPFSFNVDIVEIKE